MARVAPHEFGTIKNAVREAMDLRNDLLFYLPQERIQFYQPLLTKVEDIFKSLEVS
ncbi:hypothetical protein NQ317_004031 [Molorchus minor]|uniref:Uncharacterized protein n=1 Tax=Molorchus minor TaxID=1323400 RepID=A0ABQ9JSM9_9CUCU|nr:hypothetical protein NQ317_004031 [Molorchus minor]